MRWLDVAPPHRIAITKTVYAIDGAFALAAALLRTWATAYIEPGVVHDVSLHVSRVVADGPYRFVRNPLYLGTLALGVAFGFLASAVGFCVIVGGICLVISRLIGREEAALNASQGESYRAYCARVPRFVPALRPQVDAGGLRPRWAAAFAGELSMLSFSLAIVLFAITLDFSFLLSADRAGDRMVCAPDGSCEPRAPGQHRDDRCPSLLTDRSSRTAAACAFDDDGLDRSRARAPLKTATHRRNPQRRASTLIS